MKKILLSCALLLFLVGCNFNFYNIFNRNNTQNNQTTIIQENKNLCNMYTQNYQAYFSAKQQQCNLAGGHFVCAQNKAGCENIPAWNINLCDTDAQLQVLKAFCSVNEGHWVCDDHNIFCEVNT